MAVKLEDYFFIISLNEIKFKIWRVTFLKVFYHQEIMGWTFEFSEMTVGPQTC